MPGNKNSGPTPRYGFERLKVGDLLLVELDDSTSFERTRQAAYKFADRRGWRFRCNLFRNEVDILRVQRLG